MIYLPTWNELAQFNEIDFQNMCRNLIDSYGQMDHFHIYVDENDIGPISFTEEFQASSHTVEQQTLGEHSLRVLYQCFEQVNFYHLDGILSFEGFGILLCLHDIGKNIAVQQTSSKRNQHRFTIAMLRHALKQQQKTDYEPLLSALINMDPLGKFLKNQQSLDETEVIVRQAASLAQVSSHHFFSILKFYYFCDASAYDNLKQKIFHYLPNGQMVINPNHSRKRSFNLLCQKLMP